MILTQKIIEMNDKSKKDFLDRVFQNMMNNLEFWDVEGNLKNLKK